MTSTKQVQYHLNDQGEFIISNYNSAKLFSSFFPGVAGKKGIPMWAFYVNRAQCVCSMGVEGKHHPIMEFLPANWAYNLVPSQGFRTFIKLPDHDKIKFYEPFQDHLSDQEMQRSQKMKISSSELSIEEINHTLGLRFTVKYFNIPQDSYAGLARVLEIENLDQNPIKLEILDGLPLIIPFGIDNGALKFIRRLVEAFVEVVNHENKAPFFKGKVKPADRPDVVRIKRGNFYLGFEDSEQGVKLVTPIVDPVKIFGIRGNYEFPEGFLASASEQMSKDQIFENRLPSAMGLINTEIAQGEKYKYYSLIGHASSVAELNALIPKITHKEYISAKAHENRDIIKKITQKNFICSAKPELDHYAQQNFLDNVLRGGLPYTIKGNNSQSVLHLYSRKHGDLERDYNDYRLAPTNYSQGNGNFRDVNQNRRNDLFFNPDVREDNVVHFYNLIQLDGFNPLVIKEVRFVPKDKIEVTNYLSKFYIAGQAEQIYEFLQKSFTPGELVHQLKEMSLKIEENSELFLGNLLALCQRQHTTEHGEGYWSDHWTYNLDLIENYLAIYPKQLKYLLIDKQDFTFHDSSYRVQPRIDKYVIWDGNAMQLNSVVLDQEKQELINQRSYDKNKVRTKYGKGKVYKTTLSAKILSLIVNKMASLDPAGVGVEMETDKPNWYDALNGLPGLLGSSLSETLEIRRLILFLRAKLSIAELDQQDLTIYLELSDFLNELLALLKSDVSPYDFWDKATSLKETYRSKTRLGISGEERKISHAELISFLDACLVKLDQGIKKAWDPMQNVINTYFINKVTKHELIKIKDNNGEQKIKRNEKGLPCFRAKSFKQIALPLFLEGPVHYLRCHNDRDIAHNLAASIKRSGLYDQKLKMYKVNASLADQPMEIGRARTFSPGWFENESIWLHMEYKYMLELLRSGLYQEFYEDFTSVFVPFFAPEIYGRSTLENSSFIVSSANPDPSLHGNGFVARLSGATAEFIHILSLMTTGAAPFSLDEQGKLVFKLTPALPDWIFTNARQKKRLFIKDKWEDIEFPADSFSFMFLDTLIIYHNPTRANTFGTGKVVPAKWHLTSVDGNVLSIEGYELAEEIALKLREGNFKQIDIDLQIK